MTAQDLERDLAAAGGADDGALVSVVIAITEAEAHPREVVEGFGEALRRGGYRSEFVIVLDGPVGRFEDELRELAQRWTVHVVALEGGVSRNREVAGSNPVEGAVAPARPPVLAELEILG